MDDQAPNAPPPPPPAASTMPPVILPPDPKRPPRRGTGWMVLSLILLVVLAFSVLLNLSSLSRMVLSASGGRGAFEAGPKIQEVLLKDTPSSQKIAVIELNGLITGQAIDPAGFGLVEVIKAQLKRAAEDSRVRAVVLKLDTPGGEVLASDEINRAVAEFQERSNKPVIGAMASVAASGGYYVAAACRWIVANELTLTGSIGVIMQSYNYRGLMNKVGIRPEVYKSGRFKDMLSGAREPQDVDPEERQMLQGLIDQTYERFRNVVASGRTRASELNDQTNRTLVENWREYADGRVFSGKEAYQLGFVDELGNFEDAVRRARTIAEIGDADLVQYRQFYDLADIFRLFGRSEERMLKIDLGFEPPKLRPGALYYLCPSYVH